MRLHKTKPFLKKYLEDHINKCEKTFPHSFQLNILHTSQSVLNTFCAGPHAWLDNRSSSFPGFARVNSAPLRFAQAPTT